MRSLAARDPQLGLRAGTVVSSTLRLTRYIRRGQPVLPGNRSLRTRWRASEGEFHVEGGRKAYRQVWPPHFSGRTAGCGPLS